MQAEATGAMAMDGRQSPAASEGRDAVDPWSISRGTVRRFAGESSLTVVVLCDHAHVSGGLAQVAHASARALRRRGHRVVLLAAVPPVAPDLIEAGVEVHCLEQRDALTEPSRLKAAGRGLWNGAASRRLAAILAPLAESDTVVHVHGWSKALSPSVLRSAHRSRAAVVHTLHDYVALCPNGALYDYAKGRNCPLRPMSVRCVLCDCDARRYGHKLWRVARQATLIASGGGIAGRDVICISERQAEILRPLLPAGTVMHLVANPVDAADRGPAEVAANDTFLFVGRLSPEKGPDLLAEAARRADLRVVFVGDGPARPAVERILPGATITGWVGTPEVAGHLRRARALVFPSRWYETFGLVVQEALANGVPTIVSDNTTSASMIEHGVTGLLFRSGDTGSLIEQMRALSDQRTAARIGRQAYDRYWRRPLTLDDHVDRLEEVYRRVLQRRIAERREMAAAPSCQESGE
ncbi:MAG TPA: glycosyltransferase [Stellaceae bacterium]|nr:glycosyltransferase [Stellaceae bacterium]